MVDDGLLFPAPRIPGAQRPGSEAARVRAQVEVQFPPNPDPITETVMKQGFRDALPVRSQAWAWPRPVPMSALVTNTLDVAVTVRMHIGTSPDTGRLLATPILEFEVGAGQREMKSLNPDGDDDWGPWVWADVQPAGTPTQGDVNIEFCRSGA